MQIMRRFTTVYGFSIGKGEWSRSSEPLALPSNDVDVRVIVGRTLTQIIDTVDYITRTVLFVVHQLHHEM